MGVLSGQLLETERPQRGQCARTDRSSCCPQWQSVERLQRGRGRMATALVSAAALAPVVFVRITSLISPVVLVVTRKPSNEPDMTQKRRVWPELTRLFDPMAPMPLNLGTLCTSAPAAPSRLALVVFPCVLG